MKRWEEQGFAVLQFRSPNGEADNVRLRGIVERQNLDLVTARSLAQAVLNRERTIAEGFAREFLKSRGEKYAGTWPADARTYLGLSRVMWSWLVALALLIGCFLWWYVRHRVGG